MWLLGRNTTSNPISNSTASFLWTLSFVYSTCGTAVGLLVSVAWRGPKPDLCSGNWQTMWGSGALVTWSNFPHILVRLSLLSCLYTCREEMKLPLAVSFLPPSSFSACYLQGLAFPIRLSGTTSLAWSLWRLCHWQPISQSAFITSMAVSSWIVLAISQLPFPFCGL